MLEIMSQKSNQCVVPDCQSQINKSTTYVMPVDPYKCEAWEKVIKNSEISDIDYVTLHRNFRICKLHFSDDAYAKKPCLLKLKDDATQTLLLDQNDNSRRNIQTMQANDKQASALKLERIEHLCDKTDNTSSQLHEHLLKQHVSFNFMPTTTTTAVTKQIENEYQSLSVGNNTILSGKLSTNSNRNLNQVNSFEGMTRNFELVMCKDTEYLMINSSDLIDETKTYEGLNQVKSSEVMTEHFKLDMCKDTDPLSVNQSGITDNIKKCPKRKYLCWDVLDMQKAILAYKNGEPLNRCCKKYKIPKPTFLRHLNNKNIRANEDVKVHGRAPTLSPKLEEELIQHISKLQAHMFEITMTDVRSLAFQIAEKNGIAHNFNAQSKKAGKKWYYCFMKRHPYLSLQKSKISSNNER